MKSIFLPQLYFQSFYAHEAVMPFKKKKKKGFYLNEDWKNQGESFDLLVCFVASYQDWLKLHFRFDYTAGPGTHMRIFQIKVLLQNKLEIKFAKLKIAMEITWRSLDLSDMSAISGVIKFGVTKHRQLAFAIASPDSGRKQFWTHFLKPRISHKIVNRLMSSGGKGQKLARLPFSFSCDLWPSL